MIMKTRTIIMGSILATIGFITFAFINKPINGNAIKCGVDTTTVETKNTTKPFIELGLDEFKNPPMNQDLTYMVRGYTNQGFLRPITEQKLIDAKLISDVIENYPSTWIQDYNSVTISGIVNGEDMEASAKDATLSKEQKVILTQAPEIFICVQYQKKNYNDQVQNRQMNVSLAVTPRISAEFNGGYEQLIKYLRENSQVKIIAKNFRNLPQPSISIIINKEGFPESVVLKSTSTDDEIDKLTTLMEKMERRSSEKSDSATDVKKKYINND